MVGAVNRLHPKLFNSQLTAQSFHMESRAADQAFCGFTETTAPDLVTY